MTAGNPERKSQLGTGARRSHEFSNGAFKKGGLKPEVSRSGNHFDFKYASGQKEQLDIE